MTVDLFQAHSFISTHARRFSPFSGRAAEFLLLQQICKLDDDERDFHTQVYSQRVATAASANGFSLKPDLEPINLVHYTDIMPLVQYVH